MYKALYRKWRPLTFDDVVSQPHITTTLSNQLISGKTAHAYLFTGSRGTGKTTCARIFAKTLNCLDIKNGKPCLECDICKSADDGALSDIIEIDAASNNGVDDIREIREAAIFTPERCKYKIYIIDEVHMLSNNAFNALLKLMEEPPSYVKFILATTEIHKVPATILSRCQRYDFHRILTKDIVSRLLYIADEEKISLENDAAELIARIADGGMRDALSLLDQCIAFSENVDINTVSSAAGIAGRDYLFELLGCIVDMNASNAISIIDKLYSMSKDMQRLCEELLSQMRNLMLIKTVPDQQDLIACLPDEIEKLKTMSQKISLDEILNKLRILQECNERLLKSLSKRIELEMCLIKLCTKQVSQINVVQQVAQAPTNIAKTSNVVEQTQPQKPVENIAPQTAVEQKPIKEDFTPLDCWPEIVEDLSKDNPAISGCLTGSNAFVGERTLAIIVKGRLFVELFKNQEYRNSLDNVVKNRLGRSYVIKAKCVAEDSNTNNALDNLVAKAKDADIQVEIKK